MPKLTMRAIEQLPVRKQDYIQFDALLPGFGVRVMPTGKRFFLIQYRAVGRTRRVSLGQFGVVTADQARVRAQQLLSEIKIGGADPAAERDADRAALTVKELADRFLKDYVPMRCKPSTRSEYERCVRLFIEPRFKAIRAKAVTTASVAEFHTSLSHIPYQANRVLGVLSKMMALAEV